MIAILFNIALDILNQPTNARNFIKTVRGPFSASRLLPAGERLRIIANGQNRDICRFLACHKISSPDFL